MSENKTEQAVKDLLKYGKDCGLIRQEDMVFLANQLFDALSFAPGEDFSPDGGEEKPLSDILCHLLNDATERGVIEEGIASRDLFDTKLMGVLMPRPSEVIDTFFKLAKNDPKEATDYFYKLCCDSDYIRRYRIEKDRKWVAKTEYGELDITINLSKPEKDPKAIAAALKKKSSSYPKCLLCHENEGYAGRLDHPARQNLRQIPLRLGGEDWYLQYSPYVYYNEHCIVLSGEHHPMKIDRQTFVRLLEFVDMFPHYTVGSNADLPIVGGSILTHEHYQGGNYTFAMAKADIREELKFKEYPDIEAGILHWPMSVIRLKSKDAERLVSLCDRILSLWRGYTDESADILAESEGEPHNTITPIARRNGEVFEMDLVLRNNRTTEEYPLGIFHPHNELHHIKKENIGLIEVMGLAVLPSRLLGEMERLKEELLKGSDIHSIKEIAQHADWADELLKKHSDLNKDNIDGIIENEIGIVFSKVLEHAGVFKDTDEGREHFDRFIALI